MKASDIISVPDSRLRQHSRRIAVLDSEVEFVIERMCSATLDWEKGRSHEVGVALAAPQIGILERIVIIRSQLDNKQSRDFEVFINPEITKHEGEVTQEPEGCLSIPDMYGLVPRHDIVRVSALDRKGRPVRVKAKGFLARVFQHEIDHLHGNLFVDKVTDNEFYKILENGTLEPLPHQQIDAARVLWNR